MGLDCVASLLPEPCIKRRKVSCAQGDNAFVAGCIAKDLGWDEILMHLNGVELRKMQHNRKLHLVLDLDHTLLNSVHFPDISSDEKYLMNQEHSFQDGSVFRLDHIQMITKLRPFVRKFLEEASELFEMYIYTMGNKQYAHEMARLLDPEGFYFHSRIISREDSTERHLKGLDVILPGMDGAVVVLDDTKAVWQKHKDNLIVVDRYNFFHKSHQRFGLPGSKSLSELKTDEPEEGGLLATMLGVLRRVHSSFFEMEDDIAFRDVRGVLKSVKKEVLKDCKIVFSSIIPQGDSMCWKTAEELGATCCEEVDSSVTHVVLLHPRTDKSIWALENNKHLVYPEWIRSAFYLWKRLPEDKFLVI